MNNHHRRADQVKMCNVVADRPGIIQPFLMPAKLKNQVRFGSTKTELRFKPAGKTLVGGTQWTISPQRPGIAEPLIIAKEEQKAMAKGMAVEAKLATGEAKMVAKVQAEKAAAEVAKAQAASAEVEKAVAEEKAMAGYGYRWR